MTLTLHAQKRTEAVDVLRAKNILPAVVYGPHIEAQSIAVDASQFDKIYNEAGESTLVSLAIEGGEPLMVLIQDLQIDPVKRHVIHADFRHVTMGEEMDVAIELVFNGVAPAEKEMGGTLLKSKEEVNVRCLPTNLVDHIDIDLTQLKTFDDAIYVSDLKLPDTLTVLDGEDELIVTVNPPMSEEELNAMEQGSETDLESIEVEAKGKKEEAEEEASK